MDFTSSMSLLSISIFVYGLGLWGSVFFGSAASKAASQVPFEGASSEFNLVTRFLEATRFSDGDNLENHCTYSLA